MSKVILYLLGAGASCNVLPMASGFADRLNSFALGLKEASSKYVNSNDPLWGKDFTNLFKAVVWLAEESSHHYSVDTFAKKLFFLNDRQNLKKLKAVLSTYLVVEQSRKHVDKRYDAFFASILGFDLSRGVYLPEHIRIFTWNYDTQLEKAFYGFCKDKRKVIEDVTFNKYIYRINGCCGTNPPGHIGRSFQAALETTIDTSWEEGITLYKEYMNDPSSEPEINFAWEDPTNNKLKNVGLKMLSDISEIVMIGYSFPYFNRNIDDLIFKQFFNISRVYLQYPEGVHASIEERINRLLPPDVKIIRITSTDLFYIPDDF